MFGRNLAAVFPFLYSIIVYSFVRGMTAFLSVFVWQDEYTDCS